MTKKHLIRDKDFITAFNKVIKKKDKVIVLYSGLWSFIFNIRFKNESIPKKILEIVEGVVGKNRTLLLPSFSSEEFLAKKKFHLDKSLDKNGLLPLEALKSKKYYRTPQPLHSYLAFDKNINEIKKLKLKTSWGKKSIFQWLSKKNARLCVMGVPWNKGCSYLHRYEELNKVPWRYFKTFKGEMFDGGKKIGTCSERKYSTVTNLKYDLNPLVKEIPKKNFLRFKSKKFFLQSLTCKQIDKASVRFFKKNPWKIIKNQIEIKKFLKKSVSK